MVNEELVMSMTAPYVKDSAITYDQFSKLFKMLSLQEQYEATELLYKNGIDLIDSKEQSDVDDFILEAEGDTDIGDDEDDFEILYDENIFKDKNYSEDDVFINKTVRQTNEILCSMIQAGNKQAVQDLCVKNKRLVDKWVVLYQKRYGNRLEFEDLEQVGFLGMIKAAQKFDIKQGFSFSTYAVWWIKQAITREIMDHGYAIRIPVHMMERINKVTAEEGKYISLPLSERIKIVAKNLELPEKAVAECIILRTNYLKYSSLNTTVGDEDATELGEFIPDDINKSVEEEVNLVVLREALEQAMEGLTDRERKIIKLRFGFDDGSPRTLEAVGKEFGVTRERIRQIEAKALRKMRHPSRTKRYKDFYED